MEEHTAGWGDVESLEDLWIKEWQQRHFLEGVNVWEHVSRSVERARLALTLIETADLVKCDIGVHA